VFDAVRIRLRLRMASAEDEPGNERMKGDTLMAGSFRPLMSAALILGLFAGFAAIFRRRVEKTKGQP